MKLNSPYRKEHVTKLLDDNGSTVTNELNIVKSKSIAPTRKRYEMKYRVNTQKEEHEKMLEFSDELAKNKSMLDPVIRWEHTKLGREHGYYNLVCCYTVLEY